MTKQNNLPPHHRAVLWAETVLMLAVLLPFVFVMHWLTNGTLRGVWENFDAD